MEKDVRNLIYPVEERMDENKKGRMALQSAITFCFSPSPTIALSMFLDALFYSENARSMEELNIKLYEGWFSVENTVNNNKFTVVSVFCTEELAVEVIKIAVKAILLDTISNEERVKDLKERKYFLLVDREEVYDFVVSLPDIGAKSMTVLKTGQDHKEFTSGVVIHSNNGK